MIPLFSRYTLTRAQAEERLGRALHGDPLRGEKAALQALANLDFARCRDLLDGASIGADFKALIAARLEQAVQRDGKHFIVAALVQGNAYDHYARLARLQGVTVSVTVGAAVERDFMAACTLQQLDSEPLLPALVGYLRELVELLRHGDQEPELMARLARLAELHERLGRESTPTGAHEGGP